MQCNLVSPASAKLLENVIPFGFHLVSIYCDEMRWNDSWIFWGHGLEITYYDCHVLIPRWTHLLSHPFVCLSLQNGIFYSRNWNEWLSSFVHSGWWLCWRQFYQSDVKFPFCCCQGLQPLRNNHNLLFRNKMHLTLARVRRSNRLHGRWLLAGWGDAWHRRASRWYPARRSVPKRKRKLIQITLIRCQNKQFTHRKKSAKKE